MQSTEQTAPIHVYSLGSCIRSIKGSPSESLCTYSGVRAGHSNAKTCMYGACMMVRSRLCKF